MFNKYDVKLCKLWGNEGCIEFEANISKDPVISYVDVDSMLELFEQIPEKYMYALKIIDLFGHGIQFFHNSYVGGAYGSRSYIDTSTKNFGVILHEMGHTYEQYYRIDAGNTFILNPIWRDWIRADNIRVSGYGSNNEWEDLAEFAKYYAMWWINGDLWSLETLSPERYRIWEMIL